MGPDDAQVGRSHMKSPIIKKVERTWVSVPLKPRHARHLTRENWDRLQKKLASTKRNS